MIDDEMKDDVDPIDPDLHEEALDDELDLDEKKPKDLLNPEETESLEDLEDEELEDEDDDYGDGDDTYE